MTQMCATALEYVRILDAAADESVPPDKRCALVAIFRLVNFAAGEKDNNKPFDPMLGETFEIAVGGRQCLVELQVWALLGLLFRRAGLGREPRLFRRVFAL